jgi:LEA14-like dessication related protein
MSAISKIINTSIIGLVAYSGYRIVTEIRKAKGIDYNYNKFVIQHLDTKQMVIDFIFDIVNPTDLAVAMKYYNLDIFIDNKYVGKSILYKKQYIAANSSSDVVIRIVVDFKKYFKYTDAAYLVGVLLSKGDVKMKGSGYVGVSHSFITTKIPIEFETTMSSYLRE